MEHAYFIRLAPWMCFPNAHPHDLMWPCSILYCASLAEKCGWNARILDCHVQHETPDSLSKYIFVSKPTMVFIDTMTTTIHWAIELAELIKTQLPRVQIWGIGQHASENPQDFLFPDSSFQGVIRGEPEAVITELLTHPEKKDIPGCCYWDDDVDSSSTERVKVQELDALPPIRPLDLHLDRYRLQSANVPRFGKLRWGFLLTSRGCPYPCTFCSPTLRQSYGRDFRMQSAEKVVDDMSRLHGDYQIDAFYMIDDVFSLDKGRIEQICQLLIQRRLKISWVIQTRADLIDRELCLLLKKAGCSGIKMGIESGSPRILSQIRKNLTPEKILEGVRAIQDAELNLTTYYMLGHPSETAQEMEETFQFAQKVNADMIQVAFHTPYPGSPDWEDLGHGVRDFSQLNHYETQHVNLSEVEDSVLEAMQRNFYLRYYLQPRILKKYLRKRFIYQVSDPREWNLLTKTFTYLVVNREKGIV